MPAISIERTPPNPPTAPFQPAVGARAAISVGLADVRGDPDPGSELVTQARLWTAARCLELSPGWTRVHLPDYDGWVRATDLGAPGRTTRQVAVVIAEYQPIYANPTRRVSFPIQGSPGVPGLEVVPDVAWVGTVLPLATSRPSTQAEHIGVQLPGGRIGWVKPSAVALRPRRQPFPPLGPAAALALAYEMQGVPYLWGGTSHRGIDCSGLAQLCWRMGGATIPRDADQQYAAIPYVVEHGDLRPGDLLFFAERGRIDHVAILFEGQRFIHATGGTKRVTMNSLDPTADDYSPLLARMYAGARRPMPDMPDAPAPATKEAH